VVTSLVKTPLVDGITNETESEIPPLVRTKEPVRSSMINVESSAMASIAQVRLPSLISVMNSFSVTGEHYDGSVFPKKNQFEERPKARIAMTMPKTEAMRVVVCRAHRLPADRSARPIACMGGAGKMRCGAGALRAVFRRKPNAAVRGAFGHVRGSSVRQAAGALPLLYLCVV
jgi:hypothetical protein